MVKKGTKIKLGRSTVALKLISYIVVLLFTMICIFPFILIISASFSTESIISKEGFGLLPKGLTLVAYGWVFRYPKMILGSYAVTIIMTGCGTVLGLFMIAMTGYALQRKDFPYRNILSFFIYFTTLFSAGMAPTFIWVARYLNLKGSYLAVFLQLLMSPWLIILMKNFAKSVPYEITESGKIDGAGDFKIFISLIFPMLKPALATVGLFLALGYWNEWYQSSLYLGSSVTYKPLQYYLYNIINTANALKGSVAGANVTYTELPSNTLKMATAVVATGPIVFLYPFVQKYFISGITVGAVKG
ncbi:ABC transporter permease subunit [Anaerocolumna sedimenticola]|uniref:ABC transporter permease subunit n=1 Tax=Anaerocolumna sedimenticola TaxID=2696063 RepID=A0A6P1TTH8_9FIRM|nr:carbohydrate ABC transporter permease [Anaerocolumna sedimenticola]QHQ63251.1 ABC transporter permease subunit [Anaerocolumna sedimenticola]